MKPSPEVLITAVVAAAVFWVAYDNGGYALVSRASIAIAVWWALVVAILFGVLSKEPATRASLLVGSLLTALALWTLASLVWSPGAEKSFAEFDRVTLYLGVFALVTLGSSRRTIGRWADGLAVAVAAVAAISLASRLVPDLLPERDLATFLPGAATRLSFPLGYWNGLAIFLALGVPLLLRVAVVARTAAVRGLALAPIPMTAACIYLASSRGGVVAAVVAAVVFVACTERRWVAATALGMSALGSAAAIVVLHDRDELVNGPLATDLVERQGRTALLFIAAICVATSVAYAVGSRLLATRLRRPSPVVGWACIVAIVIASSVGIMASDPAGRIRLFKARPGELETIERGDFVRAHLLSSGGSGRWQFWSAAVDGWRDAPVVGKGAGTYEAWWAQHGSIRLFVRDAHSLYLETLAELGLLGLAIVLALVVTGLVVGVRRAQRADGDVRVTVAALTAAFAAFAAAAAFEWVWELTVVSVVAVAALALVAGQTAAAPTPLRAVDADARPRRSPGHRAGLVVASLLVAWILIIGQAVPLLAQRQIAESQEAVQDGDLDRALDAAAAARDIQPWAATPYLQLALVSEHAGRLQVARRWIADAIERDERDWRLWLVSARLETKLGRSSPAERNLRRAADLNPRSPLFQGLLPSAEE